MSYQILLYYKYVHIEKPEVVREEQRVLCQKLGLKGRIIISKEGINGTVEGTSENTETYIEAMKKHSHFFDIDFKKSEGTGNAFPKLSVKARDEIVTLGTGAADVDKEFKKGAYISPDTLQEWYEKGEDFVVVDMRNEYEHAVGRFENSVCMPIQNFKDIPDVIDTIAPLKEKKVVSVCTGGVRCEKATSYLIEQGFTDVHQLEGGMVRYLEKYPDKKFKGSLYVFDGRIVVNYDQSATHQTIGRCLLCSMPCELYVNCGDDLCHKHFICCTYCRGEKAFCSVHCSQSLLQKA